MEGGGVSTEQVQLFLALIQLAAIHVCCQEISAARR